MLAPLLHFHADRHQIGKSPMDFLFQFVPTTFDYSSSPQDRYKGLPLLYILIKVDGRTISSRSVVPWAILANPSLLGVGYNTKIGVQRKMAQKRLLKWINVKCLHCFMHMGRGIHVNVMVVARLYITLYLHPSRWMGVPMIVQHYWISFLIMYFKIHSPSLPCFKVHSTSLPCLLNG
jgi:hypothetical protein